MASAGHFDCKPTIKMTRDNVCRLDNPHFMFCSLLNERERERESVGERQWQKETFSFSHFFVWRRHDNTQTPHHYMHISDHHHHHQHHHHLLFFFDHFKITIKPKFIAHSIFIHVHYRMCTT